jgi:DNA-binding NarL/FixJ family response regulator
MRRVNPPPEHPADRLTAREREVLVLIARGQSNKEIAASLGLTEGTVKGYVSVVFDKLDVSDRTQAALYAVRHGLAPLQGPEPR